MNHIREMPDSQLPYLLWKSCIFILAGPLRLLACTVTQSYEHGGSPAWQAALLLCDGGRRGRFSEGGSIFLFHLPPAHVWGRHSPGASGPLLADLPSSSVLHKVN